ncbi:peptidase S66 [Bacillus pseudomycoides]|uniref:LD-carboxypeptidase n=1 Tax=Bacillus pseudomycoides TaxID=64104 RepID=A0AAJ3RDU1_9BACI|nr:S66 peptidase family protein [Bacillus pseudomycoides]MBD5799650.1 peptidase S66 [Bacillus pseudomycoides]MDR4327283.1 LD-carboxypeptidase [Bacillus pseudomycoides]MED1478302.1 LD-carboxypeptidase [Bacillus pseudomycoides]MED1537883.1 LD-carboxypeptidase [Bacillus pseudomycoides]MED1621857.1 LD-carboxypeptidase [Bacillus pseudomycoides]
MILLNPLKEGDTIGIYSPSSPVTYTSPERFNRAKKYLQDKGFHILEGNLTGKQDFYRSGSIQERAEELNALIRNLNVTCIMSTIGGMNSNSLLPYIDYKALKENPKIMIGYSDTTALLLGIYAQTGITTFYGPALVPSFGEFEPFVDSTYTYFAEALMEEQEIPYKVKQPLFWTDDFINWEEKTKDKELRKNEWICVNGGKTTGRLIGGNLNTIQGIWGSPFMPGIKEGDILFIEDSSKDAATIERSFSLLKINGVFDKVSGIILGKHEQFDDCGTHRKPYEILLEVLQNRNIPFLADFDCCHTHPMMTMPIGVQVEMDATNKRVRIIEQWKKQI